MTRFFRLPALVQGLLLGALVLYSAGWAHAQTPTPCGTDAAMRRALGPGYEAWQRSYRDQLRQRGLARRAARPAQAPAVTGPRLVVPVVVHVIHDGGFSNISDEQVHDAIRILNEDFQKRNADTADVLPLFQGRVGDVNLSFRLAQRDPQGNCTNGITHTYSPLTNAADDNVKDLISWDGTRYLNIWVVKNISFGAAGYAYLPCGVGPDIDGIVMLNGYTGSIGTGTPGNSRTLTHEVGHYLGLPHTWGGTNEPGVPLNCSDDDGVWDTPNTIGSAAGNCNLRQPSCPGDPDPLSNVQNYMDYSYCSVMFTEGQAEVMYDGLDTHTFGFCHATLTTAANLILTGVADGLNLPPCAPQVAISAGDGPLDAEAARGCAGDSLRFRAEAFNLPANPTLSWQWSFPGGQPATSTRRNPTVYYATPGTYDVSLTVNVGGGAGVSGSQTRSGFVQIASTSVGLPTPVITSFESALFPVDPTEPLNNWKIEAGSTPVTWEHTTAAAQLGTGAVRLRLLDLPSGARHALISPSILVDSAWRYPALSFRYAYAQQVSGNLDRLEVALSFDCGRTWSTRVRRLGNALARGNAPTNGALFVPTPADWHEEVFWIGQPLTPDRPMQVRFTAFAAQGSALYLDNLRLQQQPPVVTGVLPAAPLTVAPTLSIRPNPSAPEAPAVVYLTVPPGASATLRLRDATGRLLGPARPVAAGAHTVGLPTMAGPLAAGVYLVDLTLNDGTRLVQRALVW